MKELSPRYEKLESSGWHPIAKMAVPWMAQYIPHKPTHKQLAFLSLDQTEALYGGAAGGGKSDALLMAALQYVNVPNYSALLLRRSYTDLALPGALMDRAKAWLMPTDAHWRESAKTWHFPSGATITFGYLDQSGAEYRYQSTEFQMVGFDELTQFEENQYRYLFSRLRRLNDVNVPLRMRSASNPGGVGHEWVRERFIDGASVQDGRVFISARLADNPYLDSESYIESLNQLDPVTRRQLLDGDWTARQPGNLFHREWLTVVDELPVFINRSVRYWDLAATPKRPGSDPDYTAGVRVDYGSDGLYYIVDVQRMRGTPAEVEQRIAQTAAIDGPSTQIFIEQEPGASGVNTIHHYVTRVLPDYTVRWQRATGSKVERAGPVSSQCEVGNIRLLRGPWIVPFLDEIEAFPYGSHDDQVDGLSGAFMRLRNTATPEPLVHNLVGPRTIPPERNPLGLDPDNPIYWDTDR